MGLASLVSQPVHSVYPDANFCYWMLMHRSLHPRTSTTSYQPLENAVPMYILQSRDGKFDNTPGSWLEPNHFLSLIIEKKEAKTCPVKKQEIKDCLRVKAKQQAMLSSFIKAKSTMGSSQASRSTLIGGPSGQNEQLQLLTSAKKFNQMPKFHLRHP